MFTPCLYWTINLHYIHPLQNFTKNMFETFRWRHRCWLKRAVLLQGRYLMMQFMACKHSTTSITIPLRFFMTNFLVAGLVWFIAPAGLAKGLFSFEFRPFLLVPTRWLFISGELMLLFNNLLRLDCEKSMGGLLFIPLIYCTSLQVLVPLLFVMSPKCSLVISVGIKTQKRIVNVNIDV